MVKAAAAMTPLYEQPMLVVDPDMHTARVNSVAVDAAGRLAVTGSWDKTVRVWSLAGAPRGPRPVNRRVPMVTVAARACRGNAT